MVTQNIGNKVENDQALVFMGVSYNGDSVKKLLDKVVSSLKKPEQDKLFSLLQKIHKESPVSSQKLRELIKKINDSIKNLGVRLELSFDKRHGSLIMVYNEITNRQVTTIPFRMFMDIFKSGAKQSDQTVSESAAVSAVSDSMQKISDSIEAQKQTSLNLDLVV